MFVLTGSAQYRFFVGNKGCFATSNDQFASFATWFVNVERKPTLSSGVFLELGRKHLQQDLYGAQLDLGYNYYNNPSSFYSFRVGSLWFSKLNVMNEGQVKVLTSSDVRPFLTYFGVHYNQIFFKRLKLSLGLEKGYRLKVQNENIEFDNELNRSVIYLDFGLSVDLFILKANKVHGI